ncbi:helix-turn-helix domain-containing protein [Paenibacillus pinihumi]|uniref:helix-turn-helix domain-containing protein n=1 Tax=Paenibacillus pinihumi TaxID=669462 RepID=UPI001376AFD4
MVPSTGRIENINHLAALLIIRKSFAALGCKALFRLAAKVGHHQESITHIENGGSIARLDIVFRLAIALGMKLSLHSLIDAAKTRVG